MDLTPPPEAHHHHGGHGGHGETGRHWLDVTLGVSAVVISLFSAWMTLQHGHAMEKMVDQNERMVQASTWPYVVLSDSNGDASGKKLYRVSVVNNGVGPAKVENLEIFYHGRRVKDVFELAKQVGLRSGVTQNAVSGSDVGGVVPAHQSVAILDVQGPTSSSALIDAFGKERAAIDVRACYCSIFDDCWTTSSMNAAPPQQVPKCDPVSKPA